MAGILEIVLVTAAAWALFVRQARGWVWAVSGALYLALWPVLHDANPGWMIPAWLLFAAVVTVLGMPALRLRFLSSALMRRFQRMMPIMSDTEREALEAGSTWWEADLFNGQPDWHKLLNHGVPVLSEAEQAFLDGPVNDLCRMIDDWQITEQLHDLPEPVWEFMKQQRFFGMIIPRQYGGLEFSAHAHSSVVMKIATRSISAAVTVMVPNSLGPAQLLLHYGTEEQKNHYLPRLARGDEIPCFALTGPDAGSDAAAMANVFVKARGENMRPSWASRANTGTKLTVMMSRLKNSAGPTSLAASITCSSKSALIVSSSVALNEATS